METGSSLVENIPSRGKNCPKKDTRPGPPSSHSRMKAEAEKDEEESRPERQAAALFLYNCRPW